MDSGNNTSGSVQSSSGCEEEYDSRAESSISAFLNNNPPPPPSHAGLAPFTHSIPPQQQLHNTHHMFDPLSNYLDQMQRSPSLLNNLDMMWSSKHARSQPNPTDLCGLIPSSSSSSSQQDQSLLLSSQILGQTRDTNNAFLTTPNNPLPSPQGDGSQGLVTNNDQPHNSSNTNGVVRNSKKRSRASRRAPTTVLTTDTTNFRAMVQEFTGIPAPPFTSSFPRNRFDLFGSVVNTSNVRSTTHMEPPYLLRPFAQKIQNLNPYPPPTTSSSVVSSTFPTSSSSMLASNNSTNNSNITDHLGLMKQPFNFNTHNTNILNFQNILQPHQKYPLENPSVLPSKTQSCLEIPPPQNGVYEELGLMRHGHVNNNNNVSDLHHQNMVSSSPSFGRLGTLSSGINSNINASIEWAQRTSGTITSNDIAEQTLTNEKVHYSASSSNFHGEKGPECSTVSARNEGMLESWVNCSSDLVPPPKD